MKSMWFVVGVFVGACFFGRCVSEAKADMGSDVRALVTELRGIRQALERKCH
jgi:outer membrane murein-binding lipoprotein Lpp